MTDNPEFHVGGRRKVYVGEHEGVGVTITCWVCGRKGQILGDAPHYGEVVLDDSDCLAWAGDHAVALMQLASDLMDRRELYDGPGLRNE